jgi:hypothetical protein
MNDIQLPIEDAAIAKVARAVLDTTFPYALWGHSAHFAAALWLLRNPEVLEREGGMEAILRRYNKAVGVPDLPTRGYHETITAASMRAAQFFLEKHGKNAKLSEVLQNLMESEPGNSKWLLSYWTEESLMSPSARYGWLEPDLTPFPY